MKKTNYILFTEKEIPKNTKNISHQLMIRAGIISKNSSGIYTWLPNGIRVLKKVINIINEEMQKNNAIEINMPILQSSKLFRKSKRIELYGNELFKTLDRKKKILILSPTHEEIITSLIKNKIKSYKDLPIILYQIQTKFRDEIRPRSGVLRAREFIMKDAYSFHINKKSLKKTYSKIYKSYIKIFNSMNLNVKVIQANNGIIGGSISHEFHSQYNKNTKNNYYKKNTKKSIEIGHIFQLNQTYSKLLNLSLYNKKNKKKILEMGCYGIGVSRLIGAIIENNCDHKGIIWPAKIAPFHVSIIPINLNQDIQVKKIAKKIYKKLIHKNIEVLFYNKKEQPGIMFSETDLLGIPYKIIISQKTLLNNCVELEKRKNGSKKIIQIKKIINVILNKYKF
ncbi:proline--tRNA ligase [Buchnera aphidicola]|uniref:proline--tRNA ligase n=1 Tax=Buchnera aphidicola TaxID=9 RepID=UPI002542E62C|nr:proline--tRNA ligase [Buchnera aphidicola]WII23839.1 proline--tRNA ligase [Buchnera aphidicola (Sipha maydis)]